MMLPWGAWRPDVAGPDKPFCLDARGVQPIAGAKGLGYGPYPQLVTATGAEALSGEPRGIISLQKSDLTWEVYAATAAKIEKLDSSYQWSDVETGRTVTAGDDVSFLHYGSFLLNTDTTSGVKAYNVDSPGTNDAVTAAPDARKLFSCSNVIFALDCDGNPLRWESSARGDHTNWTTGGADGYTCQTGGPLITGCDLGNGRALIWQERAINAITFGQGPSLYTRQTMVTGRGCIHDRTMASFAEMAFWFDINGPWGFIGGALEPIGSEKINRWLEENVGPSNYSTLQAAVDPARNLVLWRLDATLLLAYNWLAKEWSLLPAATSALSRIATPGVTIDSVSSVIDTVDVAIDSRFWSGGASIIAGLDTAYKFATFSGANMAATLRSSDLVDDSEPLISWAKPVSDAADSRLSVGAAANLSSGLVFGTAVAKGSHGWTEQRSRSRVFGFRETIPAGSNWTYSSGVEIGGGPKQ